MLLACLSAAVLLTAQPEGLRVFELGASGVVTAYASDPMVAQNDAIGDVEDSIRRVIKRQIDSVESQGYTVLSVDPGDPDDPSMTVAPAYMIEIETPVKVTGCIQWYCRVRYSGRTTIHAAPVDQ